ncbi:MAG TPA: low molecular weight protein-tyrosine-phosphatase [Rhodocyclaceae bacterium]
MSVLFVCMGNICRSPTVEGVARALVRNWGLDQIVELASAGTHGYHIGEPPDQRTQQAAAERGYDLSSLRARQVSAADFARFDLILAMDRENLKLLQGACPQAYRHKLKLFLEFADGLAEDEVPDPYYGGAAGFQRVLDMAEAGARGLLATLSAMRR